MIRVNIVPSDGIASPKVVAGGYFSAVLKSDGTVWAWGRNIEYGQIGIGYIDYAKYSDRNNDFRQEYYPRQVVTAVDSDNNPVSYLTNIVDIAAGYGFVAALDKDGYVWTWGYNGNYELGRETPTDAERFVAAKATAVPTGKKIVQINTGANHTLAIDEDGYVWAWGYGGYYILGDNYNNSTYTPVRVLSGEGGFGQLRDVGYISANYVTSYAVRADGSLLVWGKNLHAMVGNNTYEHDVPYARQTRTGQQGDSSGYLQNVVHVGGFSTDYSRGNTIGVTYAVTNDANKTLYGWGYSESLALGDAYNGGYNGTVGDSSNLDGINLD